MERTKRTWFGRLTQIFRRTDLPPEVWDELEEALISADVGVQTTEDLLQRVRNDVKKVSSPTPEDVRLALRAAMLELLTPPAGAVAAAEPPAGTPMVVLVVGVNGAGKTTTIAKLAHAYLADGKRVLLAAGDTFRAAAIEQLQTWGRRAGCDVIAGQPNGDPGAVAYDAMQAGISRKADVLIIDTAGRLHTKTNLMDELRKVQRVIQRVEPTAPHEVVLVLDATTGHNGLAQATHFMQAVGVTSVVLTKLDGTAKGGTVLAVTATLGLPITFVGTGEKIDDLTPFDPEAFVDALLG